MVNKFDDIRPYNAEEFPEAMKRIALHPKLAGLPFILETPNDDEGYIAEIHTVLGWMGDSRKE